MREYREEWYEKIGKERVNSQGQGCRHTLSEEALPAVLPTYLHLYGHPTAKIQGLP